MEDGLFKQKYRTTSFRKPNWDYSSHGLYFVTICTRDRISYFGSIESASVTETVSIHTTDIGAMAGTNWLLIPQHHPYVELDDFVIMPNHIHGILFMNKPDKTSWELNKFGSQSKNLASVIRGYKSSVKAYATINNIEFAWQSKYHDRVIRDDEEYWNVKNYINKNPEQWLSDPDNILFNP